METPYREAFAYVQTLIEGKYRVPVRRVDFPEGFSGDLNGAVIFVNKNKSDEEQLFNVVHLFGHTVQWAVRPDGYELGAELFHLPSKELLERLVTYEREAARYSVAILIEAGLTELVSWLSEYSDCDIRFLEHYYRTDTKTAFDSFRRPNVPLIEPLPIPSFTPVERARRVGGIVVSTTH